MTVTVYSFWARECFLPPVLTVVICSDYTDPAYGVFSFIVDFLCVISTSTTVDFAI